MTVAQLRAALAGYPDDMPVAVRTDQGPAAGAGAAYCVRVDDYAVRDIWLEDDGGYTSPADDAPAPVPTLVLNNFYEV